MNIFLQGKHLLWGVVIAGMVSGVPAMVRAEEDPTRSIRKPLRESIAIRQQSQQELDQWEEERTRLQAEYERLQNEQEALIARKEKLTEEVASRQALNESLVRRRKESRRIQQEMLPFLEATCARLSDFVRRDTPFLETERQHRLSRLQTILAEVDVSIAEKFRKLMEAVFIEAEYGNTIEVYQKKIRLGEEEVVGDIFRLGRISLFFLARNQETAACYNVAADKWLPVDADYVPAIQAAVAIGSKQRPAELLCLPLGRLSVEP